MKEYHPPMTGLESHMEEELAKQGKNTDEAVKIARELANEEKPATASRETDQDHQVETAMHLGQ